MKLRSNKGVVLYCRHRDSFIKVLKLDVKLLAQENQL